MSRHGPTINCTYIKISPQEISDGFDLALLIFQTLLSAAIKGGLGNPFVFLTSPLEVAGFSELRRLLPS